ncbi:dephospho-CoA kinase [Clostridium sp. AM58-1XD]|uniref:dephospho-CoA kinase n=1 Tax=Clostridium sp. AM58-1XD TaxID=2292307 RepID=UPI000E4CFAF1|nr:dephospho-CoA kinase [Clostridium sp. AM58-1XD]RGY95936.1 dephospho-CoA kinase [Clostridium sp. AM58-1XD]
MEESRETGKKWIIGITGGVGSGKSRILDILKNDYNAEVILADEVAHRLMEPGALGLKKVVEALGDDFLNEDGTVDRPSLAELIFHDPGARETVNGIIHPMAWEAICGQAAEADSRLVVIEAPVVEEKVHDICDEMWYVYTSRENRTARLMESRGYSREKCRAIMESQWSDAQYRAVCQREIDNNGTVEEAEEQIHSILKTMKYIG